LSVFAGILVPGGAHIVLGKTLKGIIFVVVILASFFAGLIITHNYAFTAEAQLRHPVMFWLQYLVGAPAFLSAKLAPNFYDAKVFADSVKFEIGILYIAVAGLLNLLVFIDAMALALKPDKKQKIQKKIDRTTEKTNDSPDAVKTTSEENSEQEN